MPNKQVIQVFQFAGFGLVLLLLFSYLSFEYPRQEKKCTSPSWAVEEVDQLVDEIIRKQGGLPQVTKVTLVAHDASYPHFQYDELVLKWRVDSVETYADNSLREPEFSIVAKVSVLYANGEWRQYEWRHDRTGFVLWCALPPVTLSQFSAPAYYNTIFQSNARRAPLIEEQFEFGNEYHWRYEVRSHPNHASRVITIHSDALDSISEVQAFREYNFEVAQQIQDTHEQLDIQLLFRQPISAGAVQEILRTHQFSSATVYVASPNMYRQRVVWPIEVGGDPGLLTPGMMFSDRFSNDNVYMPVDSSQLVPIGIVSISGQISTSEYEPLLMRDDVFLIDVTPTLVRSRVQEQTSLAISETDMVGSIPVAQVMLLVQEQ